MNLVRNDLISEKNGNSRKRHVPHIVDSALSSFANLGSSESSSKDSHVRGGKDEEATVAGSNLGRKKVTNIQTIRKINPGFSWLSDSMQFEWYYQKALVSLDRASWSAVACLVHTYTGLSYYCIFFDGLILSMVIWPVHRMFSILEVCITSGNKRTT